MSKLFYFIFNSFYKDGDNPEQPIWFRTYLVITVISMMFSVGTISIVSKMMGYSMKSHRALAWGTAIFYAVFFYLKLFRNEKYLAIYNKYSKEYENADVSRYYILIWLVIASILLIPMAIVATSK